MSEFSLYLVSKEFARSSKKAKEFAKERTGATCVYAYGFNEEKCHHFNWNNIANHIGINLANNLKKSLFAANRGKLYWHIITEKF